MAVTWKTILMVLQLLAPVFGQANPERNEFVVAMKEAPVFGQANPERNEFVVALKQGQDAWASFQMLRDRLLEQGVDLKQALAVMHRDQATNQYLKETLPALSKLVEGARLEMKPYSTEHVYVFEGQESEEELAVSEKCVQDIIQYIRDIITRQYYATRMRASFGTLPLDAEFTYNIISVGNIWMCTTSQSNDSSLIRGRYCTTAFGDSGLVLGSCWPDTCSESDMNALAYLFATEIVGVDPFLSLDCQETQPWTGAEIGFTAGLAFLALMVVLGTCYDVFLKELVVKKMGEKALKPRSNPADPIAKSGGLESDQDPTDTAPSVVKGMPLMKKERQGSAINGGFVDDNEKIYGDAMNGKDVEQATKGIQAAEKPKRPVALTTLHGVLMSFSLYCNLPKLLSAKKAKGTMPVLNGLRVLSMWWVILGHSLQFYLGRINNPAEFIEEILVQMAFGAIWDAQVSVDTFFVLSGFLVTYLALIQIDTKKLNSAGSWALFYFHRWWRLTPVYMVALGIWAALWPHFGQGFLEDGLHEFIKMKCRATWWTHPLYINNLYPWPNVLADSCMGWSWYLANDMQFYIISPIILVILYRSRKAGLALISGLMVVSLSSLFALNWYYGYVLNDQERYNDNVPDPPDADIVYTKPYTRIPPYLVGMVTGYIIFKLRGKKVKMSWIVCLAGWILSLGILFAVVYGIWSTSNRYSPQIEAVAYMTFAKTAWAVAICWIIFACVKGYGGPIGVFLEWEFWVPLGRLTYCAFLVHPIVIYSRICTDEVLYHFTYVSTAYLYVGNIVFSYVAALILSLLIEGPTMGLEKVMLGKVK